MFALCSHGRMAFHCTIRCRCGNEGEFRFPDWKAGQDILRRARCSVCRSMGVQNLSFQRVTFLARSEGE